MKGLFFSLFCWNTKKKCLKLVFLNLNYFALKFNHFYLPVIPFVHFVLMIMNVDFLKYWKSWLKLVTIPKKNLLVKKERNIKNIKSNEFLLIEQFNYLKKHNHECKWNACCTFFLHETNKFFYIADHTITITEDAKDQVVAVGTILVERKFIRKNGLVGHIEDIAVNGNQQGKKLGLRIIQALKFIGAKRGCYKVILDCSEKNVPFYQKCGFTQKEVEMAWYVPQVKARL